MNISLSFLKPRYVVHEITGAVICYLEFTVNYPELLEYLCTDRYNFYNRTFLVKAVTIVKDSDVFDEAKGKKIALAKAENKAYSMIKNYVKMAEKELLNSLQAINNYTIKADKVINHNIEYLKKF